MPTNNPLPNKENSYFKRIIKCFEQKQYKNGLKFTKQILSNPKFSEHGETLSMKGLILNSMGRKDEAYELVKRGLRNDLRSHVCWHVYGLLQRSDRKYVEAIRCYQNALRWDKDNLQILRDLSLLQVQTCDYHGYQETRHRIFYLRSGQKASWIGYALATHLAEDYDTCLNIINDYIDQQAYNNTYNAEYSELLLYKLQVMADAADAADKAAARRLSKRQQQQHHCNGNGATSGSADEEEEEEEEDEDEDCPYKPRTGDYYRNMALDLITVHADAIYDPVTLLETKADLLLQLNQKKPAVAIYKDLIHRNPGNWLGYQGLEKSMDLVTEDERMKIYDQAAKDFPRALVPRRIPLNFLTGDRFRSCLDSLLRQQLHKGVPPLFAILCPLYADSDKVKIIGELLTKYEKSLKGNETFDENEDGLVKESPTTLLWTYYYLAQHCDYLGDTKRALDYINVALEHTLTLVELFVCKAKIYKHAGNMKEAVKCMDEAQSLDTADRYINSKCAKYMLRANMISEAEAMCGKFTREGVVILDDLNSMQCMWYQTECAKAFYRQGDVGEALKKCHEIDRHFSEIIDDQFDFHTYCIRKMTLRPYIELLRLENVLRKHPFYFKAACVAIQIYLDLHDKPIPTEAELQDNLINSLSEAEQKKAKSKARKKGLQESNKRYSTMTSSSTTPSTNSASSTTPSATNSGDSASSNDKKKDASTTTTGNNNKVKPAAADSPELDGPKEVKLEPQQLCRPDNPLQQAEKFLAPLQLFAADRILTHLYAFEINHRHSKVMLMLQSVNRAKKIDPNNSKLHLCIVKLLVFVEKMDRSKYDHVILKVLDSKVTELLSGCKSIVEFNKSVLESRGRNQMTRLNVAKAMHLLEPKNNSDIVTVACTLECDDVTLQGCIETLNFLKSNEDLYKLMPEDFLKQCQRKYEFSTEINENPPTPNPSNAVSNSCSSNNLIEDLDNLNIHG